MSWLDMTVFLNHTLVVLLQGQADSHDALGPTFVGHYLPSVLVCFLPSSPNKPWTVELNDKFIIKVDVSPPSLFVLIIDA